MDWFSRKYIRLIFAYMTMVITSRLLLLKKQAAYSDYLVNFQRAQPAFSGQFSARLNTAGAHSLTASYAGDANNTASTSTAVAQTVNSGIAQAYYIHTDQLDTPRVITDTAGNTVWEWRNTDPFGNNMPDENPSGLGTFVYNQRFAGQYFDKETGLHQNYFRDYDPSTGRYIEADPIGTLLYQDMAAQNLSTTGFVSSELAASLYSPAPEYNHPYAYVGGNPTGKIDPFGLANGPWANPSMQPNPNGIKVIKDVWNNMSCNSKCNAIAGLTCGPIAASSGPGPQAWGAYIACRTAVVTSCFIGCTPDSPPSCPAKGK
jgi:RHS repeat-associated protein